MRKSSQEEVKGVSKKDKFIVWNMVFQNISADAESKSRREEHNWKVWNSVHIKILDNMI